MASTQPGRRNAETPPPTRRSRRQDRIARKRPERDLATASTKGKSGGISPMILITGLAVVIGVAIIAVAVLNNRSVTGNQAAIQQPPFVTPTDLPQSGLSLGNGKVEVVVYADFQCPGCRSVYANAEQKLVDNYVKTGKITLKHHDLVVNIGKPGNTESADAANAARCAADQNRFWQLHDWLYGNQGVEYGGGFSQDRLVELGQKMGGMDQGKYESCVRDRTHAAEVEAATKVAYDGGIKSTPTITVNGVAVKEASYDNVAKAIDAALAAPAPSASAS